MTEPVSTTIGGFAAWKAFGMTIVVAICVMAVAAVVLMMRMPRSPRVGSWLDYHSNFKLGWRLFHHHQI